MQKKIFGLLAFLVGVFLFAPQALAQTTPPVQDQFYTDYKVNYDVSLTGETDVTEQVALTNLTDNYYASSFSLTIGATDLEEVQALDSGGFKMVTSVLKEGTRTKITVNFNGQVAGKGKVQSFTLTFKSKDFAQNQGKVWEVSVPKIATTQGVNSYTLNLSVPLEFGDPTSILPQPKSTSQQGDQITLSYTKDQLSESGISATFGANQLLNFSQTYHLKNSGILPSLMSVPIPSDTDYQEVQIDNIDPKPDNVSQDDDGNYLAWFKVNRYTDEDVTVTGVAKLYIKSRNLVPAALSKTLIDKYTSTQKYWEKDNPLITAKLSDIFKNGAPKTVKEQAGMINNFVVNYLVFDTTRLSSKDYTRLGGLTTLNNPQTALDNDFTDLFITLARAQGIPARELDGFAYTSNPEVRPSALGGTTLHAWAEYYDPDQGWVMVDPTWQNTSGGVDYFSKFDLNHLVLTTKGLSSVSPNTSGKVSINFSDTPFNPHPQLEVAMDVPSQLYAGLPAKVKVDIFNGGSTAQQSTQLNLASSNLKVEGNTSFMTPKIPPFGRLSYSFDLRAPSIFSSFNDTINLDIAGQKYSAQVQVKPFFTFNFLPYVIFGVLGLMALIYSGILTYHVRVYRKHKKSIKS